MASIELSGMPIMEQQICDTLRVQHARRIRRTVQCMSFCRVAQIRESQFHHDFTRHKPSSAQRAATSSQHQRSMDAHLPHVLRVLLERAFRADRFFLRTRCDGSSIQSACRLYSPRALNGRSRRLFQRFKLIRASQQRNRRPMHSVVSPRTDRCQVCHATASSARIAHVAPRES